MLEDGEIIVLGAIETKRNTRAKASSTLIVGQLSFHSWGGSRGATTNPLLRSLQSALRLPPLSTFPSYPGALILFLFVIIHFALSLTVFFA